jgi:putative autotransporter adhesin-like protein
MAATVTEQREIGEFHAISLDGIGTINFVQDEARTLTVEAEPDALPLITTEVREGTLHIQTRLISSKFISLKHPPIYSIANPNLVELVLRGAGRANVGRLKTDQLFVTVDGAGDIRLSNQTLGAARLRIAGAGSIKATGIATTQEIIITGAGNFSGDQFVGETVKVEINGAGRAKVHATEDLAAEIGGVGQVSYVGEPRVRSRVDGLGRIKKA